MGTAIGKKVRNMFGGADPFPMDLARWERLSKNMSTEMKILRLVVFCEERLTGWPGGKYGQEVTPEHYESVGVSKFEKAVIALVKDENFSKGLALIGITEFDEGRLKLLCWKLFQRGEWSDSVGSAKPAGFSN